MPEVTTHTQVMALILKVPPELTGKEEGLLRVAINNHYNNNQHNPHQYNRLRL